MRRKQTGLSGRQVEILEYITKQTALRGYPPSVREIGEAVGLQSSSTVHNHLTQLEEKGSIRGEFYPKLEIRRPMQRLVC